MKKPHILFISSWYPVKENPTHGIFNRYFAEAASRHCNVSAISVSSHPRPDSGIGTTASTDNGILTVSAYYRKVNLNIPGLSHFLKYVRSRRALMRAYAFIEKERGMPSLIQLNVIMPLGPLVLYLSRRKNIPYVISENWSGYTREDGNYRGLLLKRYTSRVVRGARRLMPTSNYLREAMERHGLHGRYTVVPNVVDTDKFRIMPHGPSKTTSFIHISSLNDREKNVSGLIRAFSGALKTDPALELEIVGTGVDQDLYRNLVNELGIRNQVTFAGRLLRDELVSAIGRTDALLMFSNYETFCLVIPEAFACGKPVITSAAGAIPSYMRPELGYMVPVGDEPALTQAIMRFASRKTAFDPGRIRQYAVDHFSYHRVGKMLHDIYLETLNESR